MMKNLSLNLNPKRSLRKQERSQVAQVSHHPNQRIKILRRDPAQNHRRLAQKRKIRKLKSVIRNWQKKIPKPRKRSRKHLHHKNQINLPSKRRIRSAIKRARKRKSRVRLQNQRSKLVIPSNLKNQRALKMQKL